MHAPSMKTLRVAAAAGAFLLILTVLFVHFFSMPLPIAGDATFGTAAIPPLHLPVLSDIAWAINLFINCALAALLLYLLLTAKKGR